MSVPSTYLMTPPSNMKDPFGGGLSSYLMVTKLRKMNPSIWVESDYEGDLTGIWRPGKATGLTCLWVGFPGSKTQSKKISAFIPGIIPEFTQLDDKGNVMTLGWRRILEKVVKRNAARQVDVERTFSTTLDIVQKEDGWCPDCMKMGKMVRSTSSRNLCDFHHQLVVSVEQSEQNKRDIEYLRRKLSCQQLPSKALSSLTECSQTKRVYG